MDIRTIREFIKLESFGGAVLFSLAVIALILSNSPLEQYYNAFFSTPMVIQVGALKIAKPLLLWVNDGLMAIFFMLVGLEIKREIFQGELNSLSKVGLPAIAAAGGMIVPALIYVAFNWGDSVALRGWAIPTATDIAFALAILSVLGKRVPVSLKIFLTALAIFDDIGAIIIIAIFYTVNISLMSLSLAGICLLALFALNRLKVMSIAPYILVGIFLWVCVLKSGVHATLAGVALAFAIPLRDPNRPNHSPAKHLEHVIHPWVAFLVLPLFAFANAGVSFDGVHMNELFGGLSMGIILGLFLGKQLGVFSFTWLAIKTGVASMPEGSNWRAIYGVALICGVGFTMSLFIGMLAFDRLGGTYAGLVRFGVLAGSLISGLLGYLLIRFSCSKQ